MAVCASHFLSGCDHSLGEHLEGGGFVSLAVERSPVYICLQAQIEAEHHGSWCTWQKRLTLWYPGSREKGVQGGPE